MHDGPQQGADGVPQESVIRPRFSLIFNHPAKAVWTPRILSADDVRVEGVELDKDI